MKNKAYRKTAQRQHQLISSFQIPEYSITIISHILWPLYVGGVTGELLLFFLRQAGDEVPGSVGLHRPDARRKEVHTVSNGDHVIHKFGVPVDKHNRIK